MFNLAGQRITIKEALVNAHKIPRLFGNSVVETYSYHRLLAAIMQDIYQPTRMDDIHALFARGEFNQQLIEDWDKNCGLNDPAAWYIAHVDNRDLKSVGYLIHDTSTGSESSFLDHSAQDAERKLCAHCISAGLISLAAWQTIGGATLTASINGKPPCYALPVGATLFETLCKCLVPCDKPGRGIWHRFVVNKEYESVPLLHGLTFVPRAIRIEWEHTPVICTRCGEPTTHWATSMIHRAGEKYVGKDWLDPYVFYRKKGDERMPVIALGEGNTNDHRSTLRYLMSEGIERPTLMRQWPNHPRWHIYGAITEQAKWIDMFEIEYVSTGPL